MTARHPPVIKDRQTELLTGVTLLVIGSWLLWDAYEGRGVRRPFALRFLPGP